jgi:hypothetical protein
MHLKVLSISTRTWKTLGPTKTDSTMRLTVPALSLAIAGLAAQSASGFTPTPPRHLAARTLHNSAALYQSTTTTADCGCADTTTFSGKPSEKALTINPRPALGSTPIYTVDGKQTSIDEQIGTTGSSIVVFLRSLG